MQNFASNTFRTPIQMLTEDVTYDVVVEETSGALFLAENVDKFLEHVLPVDEQVITSVYHKLIEDGHLHSPSEYMHTL
jgi:hypothetical protein